MDQSRATALLLLEAVLDKGTPLDEALTAVMGSLSPQDRSFSRQLVATTLRRLGQIDALIDHCLDRALPERAGRIRSILRLGVAQLLFLDTPPHAAVDTSVRLASGDKHPRVRGLKGLVNAILRRLAREGADLIAQQDDAILNVPGWLWTRWSDTYGEDQARALTRVQLEDPPLDITLKLSENGPEWAEKLGAKSVISNSLRRPKSGRVETLPGFTDGVWWVQDAAAALPARLFGAINRKTVVDLCAAPGGKTAQLADAGANVIAIDRSKQRLARLSENMIRLNLTATTVAADARSWQPNAPVDYVLLDAPCLSTGTVRRHPDIPWLKSAGELPGITPAQDALLANAATMLTPGGLLIYCVCSLEPEEGPQRIKAFLEQHSNFARTSISADEIDGLSDAITPEGDVRTLPSMLARQGGIDGFFIARLQKRL